jgi:hypothetical protein
MIDFTVQLALFSCLGIFSFWALPPADIRLSICIGCSEKGKEDSMMGLFDSFFDRDNDELLWIIIVVLVLLFLFSADRD